MEQNNKDFNPENMPQEGTPEFDSFMRQYYGDDYELGYRVSFWKRAGAYIIDKIILTFISSIIFLMNDTFMELIKDARVQNFNFMDDSFLKSFESITIEVGPIIALIAFFYFATEIFFAQSIGKMALGLKIGSENRTNADLSQLLIRYFTKYSDIVFTLLAIISGANFFETTSSFIAFIIFFGYFMVFRRERQALHDIPGKTAVFHKNAIKN